MINNKNIEDIELEDIENLIINKKEENQFLELKGSLKIIQKKKNT